MIAFFADKVGMVICHFCNVLSSRCKRCKLPAGIGTKLPVIIERFSAGQTPRYFVTLKYFQHVGMNTLPPFQPVDVVILDGDGVAKVTGIDFEGKTVVVARHLDNRIFVRCTIVIPPDNVSRIG